MARGQHAARPLDVSSGKRGGRGSREIVPWSAHSDSPRLPTVMLVIGSTDCYGFPTGRTTIESREPMLDNTRMGLGHTRKRRAMTALTLAVVLSAAACGNSGGSSSGDDEFTLRFASALPETAGMSQQAKWFLDEVVKESDGRIKIEEYWNSTLLSNTESGAGLGDGRADLAYFASVYDPSRFPLWEVGFVPIDGTDQVGLARAQARMYEESDAWRAEFQNANVKPLIALGLSDVGMVATKERLARVEDISGMSVRFVGHITKAIQAVGGNPVSLATEEVYDSLERGVIDGVGGYAMDSLTGAKLHEVAPWLHYLPVGGYGASVSVGVNADTWESLPEDLQNVFISVAEKHYDRLPDVMTELEAAACDELLAAGGGTVILPSDTPAAEEIASDAVLESVTDVWRDAAENSGADAAAIEQVEQDYESAADAVGAADDYKPGEALCAERTPSS